MLARVACEFEVRAREKLALKPPEFTVLHRLGIVFIMIGVSAMPSQAPIYLQRMQLGLAQHVGRQMTKSHFSSILMEKSYVIFTDCNLQLQNFRSTNLVLVIYIFYMYLLRLLLYVYATL